jgi:hypothetical protein
VPLWPGDPRRSLVAWMVEDAFTAGDQDRPAWLRAEQLAADVGRRVTDAFARWFGQPPETVAARLGSRLCTLSLGGTMRRRQASTVVVTLDAGERRHLELRLLLAQWGDWLTATVLDRCRSETVERASHSEVDTAVQSAQRAVSGAARGGACRVRQLRGSPRRKGGASAPKRL